MAWPLIHLNNLNPLYATMICVKFVRNCHCGSGESQTKEWNVLFITWTCDTTCTFNFCNCTSATWGHITRSSKDTYIEFSRTFQILHHNMFKTLAYSSNITQNGSCIRTLPSLTLKTLPHHPPHPPFSIYELSVFSPKLFWNFWKKHYTLNPLHQISSAPDKSHPQSYEIPPYADHSFFHYMRISITHAPQVYVV